MYVHIVDILYDKLSITSVADPGCVAFLIPGSEMGKKSRSGSGMSIPDHNFRELRNYFLVKNTKIFDADAESGMEKFGSGINIPDPQH
jgi:hypothetical protein